MTFRPDVERLAGGNALARWTHQVSEESDWSLQAYYDRTERRVDVSGFRVDRDTVDVDFQHRFNWRGRHSIVWGLGYRNSRDRIRNAFHLQFLPPNRALDRFSTFVQDQMTLVDDRLFLTAGSKFSWNDFTRFEYQPTVRLLYTPSARQSVWASVSRAVRVPSRASDDVQVITLPTATPGFPTFPTVQGNRSVNSEQLLAWELGMRSAPSDEFFWDLAAFYNYYEDLQTVAPSFPVGGPVPGSFTLPLTFFNGSDADSYGFELASTWQVKPNWKLRSGYSFLKIDVHPSPLAFTGAAAPEGESPRNQFFLHSSWDLGSCWEFDMIGRYVDSLSAVAIPRYVEMDARLAWRPTDSFEFAVIGRNLLDHAHAEFGSDTFGGVAATEVQRDVYGVASWRY